MSGGLLASIADHLRSREFIERLTMARLMARQAMVDGRPIGNDELATLLDLDPPVAQLLFNFIAAWDLSETALAEIATHMSAPRQRDIRH
ncbi:hypothetical protein [Mesorhizobium sp. B2-3-5]|uniref:hypothetical protein n=1 Tax=Mesorhizobium sp. B2-3-5 TaxID=2589958 RepID=UPI001128BB11|nr:hypothetical protein [Mesorhizobium sp. B2-3-5]TPM15525.1 hypothetical protein FJ958_29680 [Mesorhizobium sp. B2-3-5]